MFVQSCPANQAHLRSHTGQSSSAVIHGAPTGLEHRVEPQLFRALVLERLRLPLDITESRCECGNMLDVFGRHRAACPHSGRSRMRAGGPERTLARVCREAGATVRCNTKLRDMNVGVAATDQRAIEVLTSGLPINQGAQLAVDITLRCVLNVDGMATPGAAHTDGVALQRARGDKERKYTLLVHSQRCHLNVVGLETGGRLSGEAADFICQLAGSRAREASPMLRGSAFFGWQRRWTRMPLYRIFSEDVIRLCSCVKKKKILKLENCNLNGVNTHTHTKQSKHTRLHDTTGTTAHTRNNTHASQLAQHQSTPPFRGHEKQITKTGNDAT